MDTLTDQLTDPQLTDILAEPGLWLVRGGSNGVLSRANNLQSALAQAWEHGQQNQHVSAIVRMPSDEIVIPPEQIYRLWKLFRYTDAQGNVIKPASQ